MRRGGGAVSRFLVLYKRYIFSHHYLIHIRLNALYTRFRIESLKIYSILLAHTYRHVFSRIPNDRRSSVMQPVCVVGGDPHYRGIVFGLL